MGWRRIIHSARRRITFLIVLEDKEYGRKQKLGAARVAKEDEFYTQLTDVEKEMRHYRKHFKNKTVFCNCDDPFESNFFKYFVLTFNRLGLRKLIATCYVSSPIANTQLSLFDITGTVLRIKFGEVEAALRTTEQSMAKLHKLLDNKPIEYVAMALSGEMQAYCDIEDDMVKGMFGTIVQGYLKKGYNRATAEMMAREFFRYES